MARHADTLSNRTALMVALALAMALGACASQPDTAPAPPVDLKLSATPAALASSAPSTDDKPGSTGAEPPIAQSTPVPEATPPSVRALPGNPDPGSYAYRDDARQLANQIAQTMQLDPEWVWAALAQARVKDSVTKLIMPPPAGTAKNWALYRSRFVEPIRIRAGAAFWRSHAADLQRAEATYGVPADVIAGILGVETIYGRQTGRYRVLDVLTTLSLDFPKGRSDRSAFFQQELAQFLKLCQEQGTPPEATLGSFAGAIGLPQFMPSSIRRYAVDFDGDGRIDLQNSATDAIGSVGRYLAEQGWQRTWPTYFDITPPSDKAALDKLLGPDILPSFSPTDMLALGAFLPDPAKVHPGQLALVQLQNGPTAPPTLIAGTANFYAITRYNQSSYYALAVIQLGQAVAKEAARNNTQ